jgi:diguanylate cyclase (GGDEF)-like protein
MGEEASPATRPWLRRHRSWGPAALIVVMALTALSLCAPLLDAPSSSLLHPTLPWPVLVGLWVPFELVVLHLQYGKDPDNADTLLLTEIPLTLGLLLCPPVVLVAVGVLTPVLIELIRHNKSVTKQVFNGVNKGLEVGVALTLYRLLEPGDPLSLSGWAALCLVVAASSLTTSLLVSLVVTLASERVHLRDSVLHSLITIAMAVVGATVAFSSALALQDGWALAPPAVVSLAALLLLLRGFTLMTERHVSLIRLHALGRRLASAPDVPSVVHAALDACSDLLGSRHAKVYLPTTHDGDLVCVTEGPQGRPHFAPVGMEEVPKERGIVQGCTALVSSAPLRAGREVVLVLSGRRAPVRPYRREDVRILEMVAHQTAQALHTADLIDKLRRDALHDPLTDLANRRSVVATLETRLAEKESFLVACVGLLDVEKIKAALGHDHGDQLLVEVARRLCAASDPAAIVARVGDDSFAIVLPQYSGRRSPQQPVTTVLAALARPFTVGAANVFVRACAGVAEAPLEAATTGADLLRRADIAMRHVRTTGGDIATYVAELETATAAQLSLAADLRNGIARGELVLHAQPQVTLADGVVRGMEMLVRWNHPTLGLLQPGVFLPLAEQTGLEARMTAWVLEASIKILADWRRNGLEVTVSINVPASSLTSHDLCQLTEQLLITHRVPGDQVVVEITEGGLLTNIDAATEVLNGLAALGVRISIDDFGTGFSSMSRLRYLPVDEIKIDRSFVSTMLQDQEDEAIVRSIIELARSLGLVCVAEGIEDADVYAALRRLGCDLGQGYLMARPMPTEDVVYWVARSLSDGPARDAADIDGGYKGWPGDRVLQGEPATHLFA